MTKKTKMPRPAESYRGARRNQVIHTKPKLMWNYTSYYKRHFENRKEAGKYT